MGACCTSKSNPALKHKQVQFVQQVSKSTKSTLLSPKLVNSQKLGAEVAQKVQALPQRSQQQRRSYLLNTEEIKMTENEDNDLAVKMARQQRNTINRNTFQRYKPSLNFIMARKNHRFQNNILNLEELIFTPRIKTVQESSLIQRRKLIRNRPKKKTLD